MEGVKFEIVDEYVKALRGMQVVIHSSCVAAGWHSDLITGEPKERNFGEACMLMVTELAESYEASRKNLMDDHLPHRNGIEVEMADCIIRILDTAGALGLDVAGALQEKFAYNQVRADHKRENRLLENGKKT